MPRSTVPPYPQGGFAVAHEIMEKGVDFTHFETLPGWKCMRLDWQPDGPSFHLKIHVDTDAEEQAAPANKITGADSFHSDPGFLYTRSKGALDGSS
ncbi:MAG TPA: hypothetical protein DEP35_22655 [Deltaproteobacteria bacterium]|nr:hypothetical protein [Deltaproteobacteria bacterium]